MDECVLMMLAYIDPGSGSLLLQFLLAAVIGSIMFFRNQAGAVVQWVRHKVLSPRN